MRSPITFIVLIIVLLTVPSFCVAQETYSTHYVPLAGSKLWLKGSSTVNTFSCKTETITGFGRITAEEIEQDDEDTANQASGLTIKVSIPVMTLNCGNSYMNDDMRTAMKASQFPSIQYRLLETALVTPGTEPSHSLRFKTTGEITIAGTTNRIEIPVNAEPLPDGRFRLTGKKALSMLDYNITPPTAFFGLIKAHDKLVVHFDLLVGPTESSPNSLTRARSIK